MKNNKTKALKEMLSINKKVLAGLHYIKGFDFEKPFDIISGDGNFTMNSIKKQCKEQNIDTTDTTAILLMLKKQDYLENRQFYVVDVKSFIRFVICKGSAYKFNLSDFYNIGNFEATRKYNTDKYYVIIQKKEYLTKACTEKKVDYSERLEAVGKYVKWSDSNGKIRGFSSGDFKQGNKTFYINEHFKITIENPLDKSGYWIPLFKSELEQKLKAYKTEKRLNEAKGYDCTQETTEIEDKIVILKEKLAQLILDDEYTKVDNVMYKYARLCRSLKRHKDYITKGEYRSVSAIKSNIEDMNNDYNNIIKKLEQED